MRSRAERRNNTRKIIKKAENLERNLGLNGGSLFEKHRNKIKKSKGYYKKGSISHYVCTKPQIREKAKEHGSCKKHSIQKKEDSFQFQIKEYSFNDI